jgi:uncharacterized damage-inducible protein DinB
MTTRNLTADLAALIVRELQGFEREIGMFPDDESIWQTRPGVTNSAANLALHLAGNLQHFIGAVLGKTGYVRDRPVEFSKNSGTRADVIAELRRAADVVADVLPRVSDEQLQADYPEPLGTATLPMRLALLHLTSHAAFHLGQAGYLRRVITGDARSSGPIPTAALQP